MTAYRTLAAQRRPEPPTRPACWRCGVDLIKPRPDAQCIDCRTTTRFEASVQRRGIDLTLLAEDEFLELGEGMTATVYRESGADLNAREERPAA